MTRNWGILMVAAIAVVALSSCAQPGTETETPQADAAPAVEETGPDPTVVDPDHYKVELENDRVRILRIAYGPGEESVEHHHPASVAVFLTEQHAEFTKPDGTTEVIDAEAGKHQFTPAGPCLPRNVGGEPFELILVELKPDGRPAEAAAAEEVGPDPTVVDADHYKTEFENELVRLVRITYGPGEESVMHHHPDNVAVFLTEQHVEMNMADGTSEEIRGETGQPGFGPGGQHLPRNLADEPMELVLVELKDS
jgi:quercetin dioxygenase-like cupin family protein